MYNGQMNDCLGCKWNVFGARCEWRRTLYQLGKPVSLASYNTTFTQQIDFKWCCIDLSNAPGMLTGGECFPYLRHGNGNGAELHSRHSGSALDDQ